MLSLAYTCMKIKLKNNNLAAFVCKQSQLCKSLVKLELLYFRYSQNELVPAAEIRSCVSGWCRRSFGVLVR